MTKPRLSDNKIESEDQEIVDEKKVIEPHLIYEVIRREGIASLNLPSAAIWWSAIMAGIAISTSLVVEGALRHHLADSPVRYLVENLGYASGFIIVVMSRMQLFTENTMTPLLPLFISPSLKSVTLLFRLWFIVLLGNLIGTMIAAAGIAWTPMFNPDHVDAMREISHHFAQRPPALAFATGIPAGFLIASLVWMMVNADGSRLWIIVIVTYIVALIDSSHVVVGSAEVFIVMFEGGITFLPAAKLLGATLLGNIIGGSGVFSLIRYGAVRHHISQNTKPATAG